MTSQLPERLIAALRRPGALVTVVCGLGGGGEALARAVIAELSPGPVPGDPTFKHLADGDLYAWPGGQLLDLAARAGLGRARRPADSLLVQGGDSRVYFVRDRSSAQWIPGADVVDLTDEASGGAVLFCDLLAARTGLSHETATHIANSYGNATALIPELAAWLTGRTSQDGGH